MIEDWKKLEGRFFKTDVNSTTEEAMAAKDAAVIHYTTDGDIVFNGVKFCEKKKDLKIIGLYTSDDTFKYDALWGSIIGIDFEYLPWEEDGTIYEGDDDIIPKDMFLVASEKNGGPFYWFTELNNIGYRIPSKRILGVDEETFNKGWNSLDNDIVFFSKFNNVVIRARNNGNSQDYAGNLAYPFIFSYAGGYFTTIKDEDSGALAFEQKNYSLLKETYSASSLLPFTNCFIYPYYTAKKYDGHKLSYGLVCAGEGLTTHSNKDTGIDSDYIDDNHVGLLELLPAKTDTLGGVKLAPLDLQSEYEFLKTAPTVTDIDEAKVAINHLRLICKTLIDKMEAAGIVTH